MYGIYRSVLEVHGLGEEVNADGRLVGIVLTNLVEFLIKLAKSKKFLMAFNREIWIMF
jgi:hypothetical protein